MVRIWLAWVTLAPLQSPWNQATEAMYTSTIGLSV